MGLGYAAINSSFATGPVSATSGYAGGLVGSTNSAASITNSYATGDVTSSTSVGGLVGDASGLITGSYATGKVSGTSSYVGGLVGIVWSSGAITNSYASGAVSNTAGSTVSTRATHLPKPPVE